MVERREIEIFLTVGEELHFGRSAERLRVSVAMVSKTVQKLERSVGAALFERTSRRVAFTAIGRRLFEDLRPAHQAVLDAFARAVAAGRGVDGVLRVGFLGTATAEFVVRVAELLRTRHPGCEVRLHESRFTDGTAPLREDVIDVLLIDNFAAPVSTQAPELTAGPVLFREAPMLAVSARHPLARRAAVDVAEIGRYEVLRPRASPDRAVRTSAPGQPAGKAVPGQAARWAVPEGAEQLFAWPEDASSYPLGGAPAGGAAGRGAEFGSVQEMCALIGAGRGVYPVPSHASVYDARPDVAFVPIKGAPAYEWRLIWLSAADNTLVRAFAEAARDYVAAHPDPLTAPA
ncbi:LysR substrate binding domain-containing protein [Streptomyces sp. BK208]|uniref:LysR family transcriptional regulator n=1 Tax=Streptomyces sp. BK208 TaxID=2512150 RepID=UPI0010E66E02|nr:LysR substrate-binding domain-containing protein [Streptomyces sp. BK208]TDT40914.1 LysR substrate binding domain-containing protein [Streptomyces sp. BK208]